DLDVFRPADKRAARAALGLPADARICFFVARGLAANPSKDYQTLRAAITRLSELPLDQRVVFVARGEQLPTETLGQVEIRYVPWTPDPGDVVRYYQAADVYLHAARMDTFPLSVLEAQACGTPVIATAVGGIPEQVRNLCPVEGHADVPAHDTDEATGVLVPPKDGGAMAAAIEHLLRDDALRGCLGRNAARTARARFDLRRQVGDYLDWYGEIAHHAPR